MEILDAGMNYKNANNCKACPKRNDEEGCPWWWEYIQTEMSSGKERLVKQCGKTAMQVFMVEVIKASNRPAAAVESTRNEIVKGFDRLTETITSVALPSSKGLLRRMLGKGE